MNCLRRVSIIEDIGLSGMLASSRIQGCFSASSTVMRLATFLVSSLQKYTVIAAGVEEALAAFDNRGTGKVPPIGATRIQSISEKSGQRTAAYQRHHSIPYTGHLRLLTTLAGASRSCVDIDCLLTLKTEPGITSTHLETRSLAGWETSPQGSDLRSKGSRCTRPKIS